MEQHTIDIDEREHQQEECVEVTNHIRLPMKPSEPDKKEKKPMEEWTTKINNDGLGLSELQPPQTSSNQPPPPTEEEEEDSGDSSEEPCIFKVHQGLRHVNEKAYTPVLVSIGPYHRGRCELLPMERHKERYLKLLLQRNNNQREEDFLDFMRTLEERARRYYANPVDHLNSKEFVKMMLNDACFVIGFLRSMHGERDGDPIVKVTWMMQEICSDLMLLENQLPFFVLSEFYDMMNHGIRTQIPFLWHLVMYPIIEMLPRDANIFRNHFENRHLNESKHFLDVVHNVCRPLPTINADQSKHSTTRSDEGTCLGMPRVIGLEDAGVMLESKEVSPTINADQSKQSTRSDEGTCLEKPRVIEDEGTCLRMPCVIELEEAGVTFECKEVSPTIKAQHSTGSNWGTCFKMPCVEAGVTLEEPKEVSMFDIDFENGHFRIPQIVVTDSTEKFFRNIIAYEQHSLNDKPKYFTDYTYFMDLLINSKEDVSQLRCHKIIDNMLGDDKEVAIMFNKLGNGRIIFPEFYYNEVCSKVNAHCGKWWNRVVATLNRDYFKNVWVTVATFAAAFLLLLTLAQTLIALITILS